MNDPAAAASSIRGSTDPDGVDEMQTLRTGLELARASQLTMLRLQLALHKSSRRTAMQALDNLLEIDAEMENLAATLNGIPTHLANERGLFGFIGFQKEAIAAEKHVLARGGSRLEAEPVAVATADEDQASDLDLPVQPLLSDEAESTHRSGRRWHYVLAIAFLLVVLGCGLLTYMWPVLSVTLARLW